RPTATRPALPPNERHYRKPNATVTDPDRHTPMASTRVGQVCRCEAIRRSRIERLGLACGGSNRQLGRPRCGYPAKPPHLQRTDERRGGHLYGGGFGSLPGLPQRVATEQASRSTLGTWVHSKCHAPRHRAVREM